MAKPKSSKLDSQKGAAGDVWTPSKIHSTTKMPTPVIPTYDPKHITKIRMGRLSGEIFCRDPKRRIELGLSPSPTYESDFIDDLRR
jgi:hypothetical protein